jgi:N-acetylglucosamine kinase-like BadF-type ATPase
MSELRNLSVFANAKFSLSSDVEAALFGVSSNGPGIVQIQGPGLTTYGRNASGAVYAAGGYGDWRDPESCDRLTAEAIRVIVESWDDETTLAKLAFSRFGVRNCSELLSRMEILDWSAAERSNFVDDIEEAAKMGDRLAMGIINDGATRAADSVIEVASKLRIQRGTVPIGFVDDLTLLRGAFRRAMLARLVEKMPNFRLIFRSVQPAQAAAHMALATCLI